MVLSKIYVFYEFRLEYKVCVNTKGTAPAYKEKFRADSLEIFEKLVASSGSLFSLLHTYVMSLHLKWLCLMIFQLL